MIDSSINIWRDPIIQEEDALMLILCRYLHVQASTRENHAGKKDRGEARIDQSSLEVVFVCVFISVL